MGDQKIDIISFWFNEELLAPFFINHYKNIGNIKIILDADTNDRTREIAGDYIIDEIEFPEHKMNTRIKQQVLNQQYFKSNADWVIMADADEFIDMWPPIDSKADVISVILYQVYRNETDCDLDPDMLVIQQRSYGDPDIYSEPNCLYVKPMVVRGGRSFTWGEGCHRIDASIGTHFDTEMYLGAHWALADPALIERRFSRKQRRSQFNIDHGMSWHWDKEREELEELCRQHANDPKVL